MSAPFQENVTNSISPKLFHSDPYYSETYCLVLMEEKVHAHCEWTHYRDYKVGFVYITVLMHRRVVKSFSVYQGQQWSLREAGGSPTFFPASFLEEYLAIIGGDNIAGSGQ